jgi:hypothetical protein
MPLVPHFLRIVHLEAALFTLHRVYPLANITNTLSLPLPKLLPNLRLMESPVGQMSGQH